MRDGMTIRVHFIDGETRIVPAINIKHVGEEGARSATALYDDKEYPIYNRVEWGFLWEEQMEIHSGVYLQYERDCEILSPAGLCVGCVIDAQEPQS
jgi:hypothetical protein